MNFKERQEAFKAAIRKQDYTQNTKYSESFGVSNSAKIVEGGLFICNVNLSNVPEKHDQIILACLIRFPPEDEVYFSVYIRADLPALRARLTAMLDRGKELTAKYGKKSAADEDTADEETVDEEATDEDATAIKDAVPDGDRAAIRMYAKSNNNVKCYIAQDGRVYFRNKGFWDSLKFDLSEVNPGARVEKIVFSIWPPAASARRSLLAREFVGYLGNLIGRERVHEIRVWTDAAAVSPAMQRLPSTIPLPELEAAIAALGGHYPGGEVNSYHGALNFHARKHFVILSGLSGTGKTRLALQYALAVHGFTDNDARDPFLFVCAVRPEWTDPTGLTGYYDVLSNRYIVPPFLEAALVATAHHTSPVFVVLDELNLARVEYYLSDVLSAIETGGELQLHSNNVPLEGSTGVSIRASLPIPANLYITGTINVDETTHPVSDKVLDRANVIDMSKVDLAGFLQGLEAREPDLKDARAAAEPLLLAVHELLLQHGLGFGYRVAEEVIRYHAFAAKKLSSTQDEVNDQLMVQKVLVKLRGSDRQRSLLTGLDRILGGMPRAKTLLGQLTADLDEFGSFQATR
jgi:5-methylcytosine-specific restriction enzyme B